MKGAGHGLDDRYNYNEVFRTVMVEVNIKKRFVERTRSYFSYLMDDGSLGNVAEWIKTKAP